MIDWKLVWDVGLFIGAQWAQFDELSPPPSQFQQIPQQHEILQIIMFFHLEITQVEYFSVLYK